MSNHNNTQLGEERLEPCPFCPHGIGFLRNESGRYNGVVWVECDWPSHAVRLVAGEDAAPPCGARTAEYQTEQEAAKAWNSRTAVAAPQGEVGISWPALLSVLERLRSKNRNPNNEWYHGWNAAIQCLINDINARKSLPVTAPQGDALWKAVADFGYLIHRELHNTATEWHECELGVCRRARALLSPATAEPTAGADGRYCQHHDDDPAHGKECYESPSLKVEEVGPRICIKCGHEERHSDNEAGKCEKSAWVWDDPTGGMCACVCEFPATTPVPPSEVEEVAAGEQKIDFSCHVCGVQCDTAPDPPARAVCPEHCGDHDYRYERELRGTYCLHCGQQAPEDWYDD